MHFHGSMRLPSLGLERTERELGRSCIPKSTGDNSLTRRVQAHNIQGLWFQKPYTEWCLGPEFFNVRYLDPLGEELGHGDPFDLNEQGPQA